MTEKTILRVALPVPLPGLFDYLTPENFHAEIPQAGSRLLVPFGNTRKVGYLIEVSDKSQVATDRLKPCLQILDHEPILSDSHIALLKWASTYYHHPLGEVITAALPSDLRKGAEAIIAKQMFWSLTDQAPDPDNNRLTRAPKQIEMITFLLDYPQGCCADHLQSIGKNWRSTINRLIEKGWVKTKEIHALPAIKPITPPTRIQLNADQNKAVSRVCDSLDRFQTFLLDGITGSGKTEVYFRIIEKVITNDKQALILIPEISLTTQLMERFKQHFPSHLAMMHSGLNESERLQSWLKVRAGLASIVIGTRSSIWASFKDLGVIIIDEEHDASYKQQDGFRYSARDIAILRAQRQKIPVVLGSATPSLESLHNVEKNRSAHLILSQRAGTAKPPQIRFLDIRQSHLEGGMSEILLSKIKSCLQANQQALLFLNRRGYSPVLMCHDCGWVGNCEYCDTHLTYHQHDQLMRCHHCGAQQKNISQCPTCQQSTLAPVGQGTEKVTEVLATQFPEARIMRIDRDTTRKKGEMAQRLKMIKQGEVDILVGTQMLSKGHHFPKVTLAGILDADSRLYSTDFRASERLAQLITQVAGRAGREEQVGEVLIQTHHPDHPLLQALAKQDYSIISRLLMEERLAINLPPFACMALIRADSLNKGEALNFLQQTKNRVETGATTQLWGPVPASMEKRAGRYRAQLMLQDNDRRQLHKMLSVCTQTIQQLKKPATLRWSLDVDPQDTL